MTARMIFARAALSLAVVGALTSFAAAAPSELNRKQTAAALEVVTAWRNRDAVAALKLLPKLAASLSRDQLAAVDALFTEQQVPSAAEIIARARMRLAGTAIESEPPAPRPHEVALALPAVRQHVDYLRGQVQGANVMADPLPSPDALAEYDPLLREVRQVSVMLRQGVAIAQFAAKYAKVAAKPPPGVTAAQTAALETNFSQLAAQFTAQQRELAEREIELRTQRIHHAARTLVGDAPLKARFYAMYALDADGFRVVEFFEQDDRARAGRLSRPRLTTPGLGLEIKRRVEAGRKAAGSHLAISRRLFAGLGWWLRGRYGTTTPSDGWLKPVAAARTTRDVDPLYLPAGDLEPTDPFLPLSQTLPVYDRRHHFTWVWENRSFYWCRRYDCGAITDCESSSGRREWLTDCQSDLQYRYPAIIDRTCGAGYTLHGRITLRSPETPRRLVGYDEYVKALAHFDELLDKATPDELRVADEIVRESPAFAIYTNLSRGVERAPSAVTEAPRQPGDRFRREGLAWVVALARVEVGAILSLCTSVPRPFETVVPTKYEQAAYLELLRDGARTHYWTIRFDPEVTRVLRQAYDERLLAYLNRVILAREFVHTAAKLGKPTDSRAEFEVWQSWDADLDDIHDALADKIARLLNDRSPSPTYRLTLEEWRTQLHCLPATQAAVTASQGRTGAKRR